MRLACGDCDTTEGDGVDHVPRGWRDVAACDGWASPTPGVWYTHLGTCPECDVRANGLSITISGSAVPQPRYERNAKTKRHYLPASNPVHAYKEAVRTIARHAFAGEPLDNIAVELWIECVFDRPQRLLRPGMPDGRIPYTAKSRNDWDNLAKSTCDALQGVWFADDGLVYRGTCERWYAARGEAAHVQVTLTLGESLP